MVVEPINGSLVAATVAIYVRVNGQFDRCAAELTLDVLGALALLQKQSSVAVPEAVRREVMRQARGLQHPPQRPSDVHLIEQPT